MEPLEEASRLAAAPLSPPVSRRQTRLDRPAIPAEEAVVAAEAAALDLRPYLPAARPTSSLAPEQAWEPQAAAEAAAQQSHKV